MLVKWIVATVPHDRREAFSASQEVWGALAHCEGFLGQVGGWNTDGRACIVGLWRDAGTYGRFMAHTHDPILRADSGPPAFSSLDITTAELVVRVGGAAGGLDAAIADARWMRMTDCSVAPEGADAFVAGVLRERVPRLRGLEGLLAAGWSVADTQRWLGLSLWSAADVPAGPLPVVRGPRAPAAPVSALRAHRVALEPSWTVLPG